MYLIPEDYEAVCSENELDILQQSSEQIRERAELTAMEEVASYLRTRYDIKKTFAAQGRDRNPFLVQLCVNVTLFYMVQWLPRKMASANRAELYDNALSWLKSVQSGKASPDLPWRVDGEESEAGSYPMIVGGMPRQRYDW